MADETSTPAPRVLVIALGGTIAMTAADSGGVTPSLTARQLVDAVPGLGETGIDIDVLTFRSKPGASLTIDDLTALTTRLGDYWDAGITGVVITQGTDTIEESAYALDLLHAGPQPLVVTGAMRNPTLAGADGPANLLAAIQVAASSAARGLGCVVVLADEIHAARRVRKTHSTSIATFASPNGGPLGYLVEGHVTIANHISGRLVVPAGHQSAPLVRLYTATLGDDGAPLAALAAGADGLVVAGFGVGHVPESWVPALTEAASRIPVVLTSRTGSGPVLAGTYGFPGSERDLISRGLIPAGFLDPYKARILLHLALAAGADRDQVSAAFAATAELPGSRGWPWAAETPPSVHALARATDPVRISKA
ncbi:asparaginase [Amorphoplanes nipponensis]|uniref:L-asparaginase n=1 Tax=Actinoplanes nipponensis TaxID=135950 RepID=A0A919JLN3_9ACTN|nr:asparaginase [Actinoplanes nipponensis]GIE51510.1 L-asparaginase [Actinoplanes nipponensis]